MNKAICSVWLLGNDAGTHFDNKWHTKAADMHMELLFLIIKMPENFHHDASESFFAQLSYALFITRSEKCSSICFGDEITSEWVSGNISFWGGTVK
jgi:hypothetical protein